MLVSEAIVLPIAVVFLVVVLVFMSLKEAQRILDRERNDARAKARDELEMKRK